MEGKGSEVHVLPLVWLLKGWSSSVSTALHRVKNLTRLERHSHVLVAPSRPVHSGQPDTNNEEFNQEGLPRVAGGQKHYVNSSCQVLPQPVDPPQPVDYRFWPNYAELVPRASFDTQISVSKKTCSFQVLLNPPEVHFRS